MAQRRLEGFTLKLNLFNTIIKEDSMTNKIPPRWECIETKTDSKRFHYGRFILSPLLAGQADTIGIAMRRSLLGEVEGTCITRAKFEKAIHEYSTIFGIEESVHEILMNLKEIVLRGNLYGIHDAYICVRGPGCVTARDIFLPPSVEIVDAAQHIATLTKPINLRIELQIERSRGYSMRTPKNYNDGSYPIDAVFMPVRNVNYGIHSYGNEKQEILFLEICTNGSLTPKEALHAASHKFLNLFVPFLDAEEQDLNFDPEDDQNEFQGKFIFATPYFFFFGDTLKNLIKKNKRTELESIFLDQLALTRKTYNCLMKFNIHTLWDFIHIPCLDFAKMQMNFCVDDLKRIMYFLVEHCLIDEPKKGRKSNGF